MRVTLGNIIATGFSSLIGIGVALLYYFKNPFYCRTTIPLIILAAIALVVIFLVVLVTSNGLPGKNEKEIRAVCEHGFLLAIAAILTLIFVLISFFVCFKYVTIFTFILILFGSLFAVLMFISLFCFIYYLIRQSCQCSYR